MCQIVTVLVSTSTPSSSAWQAASDWVVNISRRRGSRSATAPPTSDSSMIGRNCSEVTVASAMGELVSCSTSQACAVPCIQGPQTEISEPRK